MNGILSWWDGVELWLSGLGFVFQSVVVMPVVLLLAYVIAAALDAMLGRGIQVIIAGAGGAAHLPGMLSAKTRLPVFGVPVQSKALNGMDSLLSIAQMPAGIPVGTLAIGRAGAVNAGLLAASVLALHDASLATALDNYRARQTQSVLDHPDPRS